MWHLFNLSPPHMHTLTHIHRCKSMHTSIYYTHMNYTYILCTYILNLHISHIHILHTHTPHTHTHKFLIIFFNDIVNNLTVYFMQTVLKILNLKVKPLSLSSAKIQAHNSLDCQLAQCALSVGWTECGCSWAVPREMDNCVVWWKCEHLCVLEENFWDVLGEQPDWEALPLGIQ